MSVSYLKHKIIFLLFTFFVQANVLPGICQTGQAQNNHSSWTGIEKQLKECTYQLNVGLKIKLPDKSFAYLIDLSPQNKLPVFGTMKIDKGFHIVGSGTAFAIQTKDQSASYFFSNKHVVESGAPLAQEAQRFFAAIELYAEKVAGKQGSLQARNQILDDINLGYKPTRNRSEQERYERAVNNVWQIYHKYLSPSKSPQRTNPTTNNIERYSKLSGIKIVFAYFLHKHGPVSNKAIQARLLAHNSGTSDIAMLQAGGLRLPSLPLASNAARKGDPIIIAGYPLAADRQDPSSGQRYRVSTCYGKVKQVTPSIILLEAVVEPGNSGSPVVNLHGQAIGMIVSKHSGTTAPGKTSRSISESKAIPASVLKQALP